MRDVRTWIEIDGRALRHNAGEFFKLVPKETRLMAVVKSNAYGHGLVPVAKSLVALRGFAGRGWFGVDSIVEGLRLRKEGITNPMLVLGHTLPSRISDAASAEIVLTISSFDALRALAAVKPNPAFHVKVDTGMHRQGFMPRDILPLIKDLKRLHMVPQGTYTHFASAKDPHDRAYTEFQIKQFREIIFSFRQSGFQNLICHAAATGGTLLFPEAHFDMVRIGMGLYGYWPAGELRSSNYELRMKKEEKSEMELKPVLTWKSLIAEIKTIPQGALVGYDGTKQVRHQTRIAVVPIGYWHGYDRRFSNIGTMLVGGKRAPVLGVVSMDMAVIEVTGIRGVKIGDEVVIIGRQNKEIVGADELAGRIGTTAYELLTRINPLIRRNLA